jgi:YgiT-type zinc finger domain-containing protein
VDPVERKEEAMKYVEKCPQCGGHVIEKEIREILSGGTNTAFFTVQAGVCLGCGEKLYAPETIRRFEEIETQLKNQQTDLYQPVGRSFQIVS